MDALCLTVSGQVQERVLWRGLEKRRLVLLKGHSGGWVGGAGAPMCRDCFLAAVAPGSVPSCGPFAMCPSFSLPRFLSDYSAVLSNKATKSQTPLKILLNTLISYSGKCHNHINTAKVALMNKASSL